MAAIGWIIVGLASMTGTTLLRGVVLQALWTWFVAETFGITTLSLPQAIGLSMVVTFLVYQENTYRDESKSAGERFLASVITSLMLSGFAYLFGAIVHSFA